MAQLFDVGVPAISKHLKNIFEEGDQIDNQVFIIAEIGQKLRIEYKNYLK